MANMNLLQNKTAIITGGSTGIGSAIALEFVRNGCTVIINHLGHPKDKSSLDNLLKTASSISKKNGNIGSLHHLAGDVRLPKTATDLVAFAISKSPKKRLDICVSNAGICQFSEIFDISKNLFENTVATNLTGAFYIVQAAGRQMANQSPAGGSIIGVSSISALVGGGQQVHYTPTKAGVLSLMQSSAVALGKYGIRCNAILPGTIHTQLNTEDLKNDEKRKYMEGRIPLGRIGEPSDIAGPAVFLACEELSRYVTGAQLLVDGGAFVSLQ